MTRRVGGEHGTRRSGRIAAIEQAKVKASWSVGASERAQLCDQMAQTNQVPALSEPIDPGDIVVIHILLGMKNYNSFKEGIHMWVELGQGELYKLTKVSENVFKNPEGELFYIYQNSHTEESGRVIDYSAVEYRMLPHFLQT